MIYNVISGPSHHWFSPGSKLFWLQSVLSKTYNSPRKSQENVSVCPLPRPTQCCLSWQSHHCSLTTLSGGREVSILVTPLGIVSKMACQHILVLSDLGVPRTYIILTSWIVAFLNGKVMLKHGLAASQ